MGGSASLPASPSAGPAHDWISGGRNPPLVRIRLDDHGTITAFLVDDAGVGALPGPGAEEGRDPTGARRQALVHMAGSDARDTMRQ